MKRTYIAYIAMVLTTVFFILFIPTTTTSAFTIPEGSYAFTDKGVLTDSKGNENKNLLKAILDGKQTAVISDFRKMLKNEFKDTSFVGGLHIEGGGSMWDYDLSDLRSNSTSTTFYFEQQGKEYKIYVPANADGSNNRTVNFTIGAIKEYQEAVKEGIMYGSMELSYNIYTMYPNRQIPVIDILEDELNEEFRRTGNKIIKSSMAGATMNYSLDSFINPLFGKMPAEDIVVAGKKPQEIFDAKVSDIDIKVTSNNKKVEFTVHDEFLSFLAQVEAGTSPYTDVKTESISKSDGVTVYKASRTSKEAKPLSMIDGAMQLIVPTVYHEDIDIEGRYKLTKTTEEGKESGYRPIEGIKLNISNFYVFQNDSRVGDFASFGIDLKSLVLTYITVNSEGEYDSGGRKIGAVIPLWYKEAIASSLLTDGEELYMTGRTIRLDNDYSGKITLDTSNLDLMATNSKGSGKQGIELRRFAFALDTDYNNSQSHNTLGESPDKFQLHIIFNNTLTSGEDTGSGEDLVGGEDSMTDSGLNGFFIVRNNWYLTDESLLKWLQTEEAEAMTDVESKELYGLITGDLDSVVSEALTYEKWNRLEEIKRELDVTFTSKMTTLIRVIGIIFGVFLIFYSIMLVIAYWIDLFNVLVEFSIVHLMTNKRLYPVHSKEDKDYLQVRGDNIKYVTFRDIFFIMLVGILLGITFVYSTPIIKMLVWIYIQITEWVGVV